ncbi:hypothetical protein [Spirillospora sp. CA-128828]|uniref:hypothetical protein n=1 Tax=Spirillospora sp. CA-128828 TaxID=3240033 RepID=UPI003D8DB7BC
MTRIMIVGGGIAGNAAALAQVGAAAAVAASGFPITRLRLTDATGDVAVKELVLPRKTSEARREPAVQRALREVRAAALGIEMLDAMSTAHEHGVLHRDVKPANPLRAGGGPDAVRPVDADGRAGRGPDRRTGPAPRAP